MSKELNCLNCCIGDFKQSLCDCNNGMCKEYKKVGNSEDFEKEVLKRTKPKTGEWIPCEERLPDNKTYVLTTIQVSGRQPHARSGFYHDGFFHNDNGDTWTATDREVTAWMPLPEPYGADISENGADIGKKKLEYGAERR